MTRNTSDYRSWRSASSILPSRIEWEGIKLCLRLFLSFFLSFFLFFLSFHLISILNVSFFSSVSGDDEFEANDENFAVRQKKWVKRRLQFRASTRKNEHTLIKPHETSKELYPGRPNIDFIWNFDSQINLIRSELEQIWHGKLTSLFLTIRLFHACFIIVKVFMLPITSIEPFYTPWTCAEIAIDTSNQGFNTFSQSLETKRLISVLCPLIECSKCRHHLLSSLSPLWFDHRPEVRRKKEESLSIHSFIPSFLLHACLSITRNRRQWGTTCTT